MSNEIPLIVDFQIKNLAQTQTQLKQMGTVAQETGGKFKTVGTNIDSAAKSTQSMGSRVSDFGARFGTVAIGLATVAQGVVGLIRSYRDLSDTQLAVDKSTKKLSLAHEAIAKATTDLAVAQKKYGKGSKEYAAAALNLQQAQQGLGIAEETLTESKERQADAYQDFYLNMVPTIIGISGTFFTAMSAFKKTGFESSAAAGGLLTKLGPLGLAIGVLAGVFLAIKTNFLGFRDALTSTGEALGNAFPGLKPLLNLLGEVGGMLGLGTGKAGRGGNLPFKSAGGIGGALNSLKDQFGGIAKWFGGIISMIQKGDWGGAFATISTAAKNMWQHIKATVPIFGTIETFINKIKEGKWADAWATMVTGAKSAWDSVVAVIPILGEQANMIQTIIANMKAGNWKGVWQTIIEGATKWWESDGTKFFVALGSTLVTSILAGIKSVDVTGAITGPEGPIQQIKDGFAQLKQGNLFEGVSLFSGGGSELLVQLGIGPGAIIQAIKDPKQQAMWSGIFTAIGEAIKSSFPTLTAFSRSVIDPFLASLFQADTWISAISEAGSKLSDIGTAIWSGITGFLKSVDPTTLTGIGEAGGAMWSALVGWMEINLPDATKAMQNLAQSFVTAVDTAVDAWKNVGISIWNSIVEAMKSSTRLAGIGGALDTLKITPKVTPELDDSSLINQWDQTKQLLENTQPQAMTIPAPNISNISTAVESIKGSLTNISLSAIVVPSPNISAVKEGANKAQGLIDSVKGRTVNMMVNVGLSGPGVPFIGHAAHGANFTTNGPQLLLVGDNPSGREAVKVTPLGAGSGGGGSKIKSRSMSPTAIPNMAASRGGGSGSGSAVIHTHIILNGKEIAEAVSEHMDDGSSGYR